MFGHPFPWVPIGLETAKNRLLITLATYNEIENLPRLVAELRSIVPEADILVVDDHSPDGTGAWVAQQQQSESQANRSQGRLHLVERAGKLGLGTATLAAMRFAIEHEYDWMLNLDADFSHDPKYLPAILAVRDQADIVIGSRYVAGGGVRHWPLSRRLSSACVNLAARWLLWLKPRDCSGAYRAWRVELLRRMPLDSIVSRGYAFQEESLWHARRAGARMMEVPIVFGDREQGQSKINAREAWAAVGILLRFGVRTWFFWG